MHCPEEKARPPVPLSTSARYQLSANTRAHCRPCPAEQKRGFHQPPHCTKPHSHRPGTCCSHHCRRWSTSTTVRRRSGRRFVGIESSVGTGCPLVSNEHE